MERIDEAVASVETMDIMTSILLEVNPVMSWISWISWISFDVK